MKINIIIIISLLSIKGFCQKDTTLFKKQELIINKKSAFFKGKEIYNAERDLKELTEQEKTDECIVNYEFYNNPLSLVGTYYSYESGEGGVIACGVPSNTLNVLTIDLDNNKAISLSDIFLEESIIKALKDDNWVKKNMDERKIDFQSINSFEVFMDTINSLGYAKFKSNSFAVLGYNKKNGYVSVRLVGEEYMGFNHNKHLQLGLWVKPKESYKELFKNKIHFTIGDYKSGLKK
ncbi:hypothetical protein [Zobellia russellii]|uniref:hypothetical protein n=1 Tax=Zobellia russellii TaxID=248907 RepID=UPI0037DC3A38